MYYRDMNYDHNLEDSPEMSLESSSCTEDSDDNLTRSNFAKPVVPLVKNKPAGKKGKIDLELVLSD
jgi:hypothetical protein